MRERRLFLEVERQFSSLEGSFSNQGSLGESALKNTPQMRHVPNERDENSAQDVEIINVDDLEIAPPPKKRYRTKRSTTPSIIRTKSANKSLLAANPNSAAKPE